MSDETIATGYLRLVPTVDGIQGAIGGQMATAGAAGGAAFAGGFVPSLKGLLIAAGGTLIAREVKQFVSEGIDALSRIETIQAQTISVIRSTGGAANVSANEVNQLADSLERTTASESETIREGANLLLTFKNIRNEAGDGNDIFNQTVKAMVDVGRAMGTDASGAAIQLGKALNDPVAGIAALTRVGITFTDQQKEQIRALTESGDLLSAQKIILAELESQFGGSGAAFAETYAGKVLLVQNAYGDIQERLTSGLMPTLKGFADLALDVLERINNSPSFDGIIGRLNEIGDGLQDKAGAVVDLIAKLTESGDIDASSILGGLSEIFPQLEPLLTLAGGLLPALPAVRDGLVAIGSALTQEGVLDAIVLLITEALPPLVDLLVELAPLIPPLAAALGEVLPVAIGLLRLNALDPLLSILGLLQVAFGDRSFVDWALAMQNSGNGLYSFAQGIAGFVKDMINPIIDGLNGLGDAVEGFVNGISRIFGGGGISLPNIQRLTSAVSISAAAARSVGAHIPRMADGGTIERAGWAMVGEAGPELINMNIGAQVRPLDYRAGGEGGISVVNNIYEAQEDGRILGRKFGREFAAQIGG